MESIHSGTLVIDKGLFGQYTALKLQNMMKSYELMTIYKISLGEEAAKKLSSDVAKLITTLGGSMVDSNFWGKRKLAYEIKHTKEGFFDVMTIQLPTDAIANFKTKMGLMTDIIRYLVTAK